MEFWGVEVKPGQTVKCEPGEGRLLHLSQAALGEVKKDKGTENVPIFVNINEQKLVIGTLSAENCTQIQYDVVFEKEFELSHGSKNGSVFFVGYKSNHQGYESEDDFYGSDSEDELQLDEKANAGKALDKSSQKKATTEKAVAVKDDAVAGKAKAKTGKPDKIDGSKPSFLEEDDEDDDEDDGDEEDDAEESDDDDEELPKVGMDSDDEIDEDDSSEDEEANLKKRSADGKLKSPIPVKKTKVQMPSGNKKAGGEVKKGGQTATPKQAGKPATGDKAKQQTPKSTGSVVCKSCNKSFNSENALQDHTKAKHSGTK